MADSNTITKRKNIDSEKSNKRLCLNDTENNMIDEKHIEFEQNIYDQLYSAVITHDIHIVDKFCKENRDKISNQQNAFQYCLHTKAINMIILAASHISNLDYLKQLVNYIYPFVDESKAIEMIFKKIECHSEEECDYTPCLIEQIYKKVNNFEYISLIDKYLDYPIYIFRIPV